MYVINLVLVYVIPIALLFLVPAWLTLKLHQKRVWIVYRLLPLIIPLATVASEIFPRILIQSIVKAPLDNSEKIDRIESLYVRDRTAKEAGRFLARYPTLKFSEGIIEHPRPKNRFSEWDSMPAGSFKFFGRREVQGSSDCQSDEIAQGFGASGTRSEQKWYCITWKPISDFGSTHETQFTLIKRKVGPYSVSEIRDSIVRRSDQKEVRSVTDAEISGGIMWHFGNWLGGDFVSGFSRPGYVAQTSDYLDSNNPEEYLITGKR
jgi:hypothetical protein